MNRRSIPVSVTEVQEGDTLRVRGAVRTASGPAKEITALGIPRVKVPLVPVAMLADEQYYEPSAHVRVGRCNG